MKAALLKSLSFLIAPAFLFAFTSTLYKSNFSGEWKLNESKSELGDFSGFVARSLKVEQKEKDITITKNNAWF